MGAPTCDFGWDSRLVIDQKGVVFVRNLTRLTVSNIDNFEIAQCCLHDRRRAWPASGLVAWAAVGGGGGGGGEQVVSSSQFL